MMKVRVSPHTHTLPLTLTKAITANCIFQTVVLFLRLLFRAKSTRHYTILCASIMVSMFSLNSLFPLNGAHPRQPVRLCAAYVMLVRPGSHDVRVTSRAPQRDQRTSRAPKCDKSVYRSKIQPIDIKQEE